MSRPSTDLPRYEQRAVNRLARTFEDQLRELRDAVSPTGLRDTIPLTIELAGRTRQLLLSAVELDRARGRSWEAIGADLGITRQAAHERFAHRLGENLPAIRALAEQGRGEAEDVLDIDQEIGRLERTVAPDPVSISPHADGGRLSPDG